MKIRFLMAGVAISTMLPVAAEAAVVVNYAQVGVNVVATTTGTLNTAGLTSIVNFVFPIAVAGNFAYVASGDVLSERGIAYSGFTSGPTAIGSGSKVTYASFSKGNTFAYNAANQLIFTASDFVSGGSVAGTATFTNTTLDALGLTAGTYIFRSTGDTLTVNVGNVAGAVPEPATWAMMTLGFGGMGFAMRRKKASPRIRFA